MGGPLAASLRPCGPVVDAAVAERTREVLAEATGEGGWSVKLDQAWPALAPVFAASPYLTGLARRRPEALAAMLGETPEAALDRLLATVEAVATAPDDAARTLRRAKADAHLLIALADLGGVWSLEQVTNALSRFADACVAAALAVVAGQELARGRLLLDLTDSTDSFPSPFGPVPGYFLLALGKHGAGELNYSSDIDVTAFYDAERLPLAPGLEPQAFAVRLTKALAALLQDRTVDGYVFRVDLRLRPDPSLTPPAVPVEAALQYYESVGQNWERAAHIKARACAGDRAGAEAFLKALQPFVWRRSLDYAAIEDVKAVKQQIHAVRGGETTVAAGADLKLGRGGIREIEFFAQTQQLILGGRNPTLRSPRTVEALRALAEAGCLDPAAADELIADYGVLRDLEHRVQMLEDEHTHRLPLDPEARGRVAALAGEGDLAAFDARVTTLLERVNRRYADLFSDAEPLSAPEGSLVFTGVEDDPETLHTLERMGFAAPASVSSAIRDWHHGRIAATRSERGRELFTRLAPRLLTAVAATGAPDVAFGRFGVFFEGLRGGVGVQALMLAQPNLLDLLVRVLAFSPRLAASLSRGPAALDALLDADFFSALGDTPQPAIDAADLEGAMNAVRRAHRDRSFRIGLHILTGRASGAEAGRALSDLADACIRALAPAAFADVARVAGDFPGRAAVVALGKAGSREMTFGSDLDLMLVYEAPPGAESSVKGWAAETWYGRACQRLVAALSTPTAEGGLYDVDLRLRPTGGKGPVAVPLAALEAYHRDEAETWELMALTRARVVWSDDAEFAERVGSALTHALRRRQQPDVLARDVREMRALMQAGRDDRGSWSLKHGDGGLIDVEFAAQYLQLLHAADGGPLHAQPGEALAALTAAGLADAAVVDPVRRAWALQSDLSQVLKVAFAEERDPSDEPEAFRALLAAAAGEASFDDLAQTLPAVRAAAHAAWLTATEPASIAVRPS